MTIRLVFRKKIQSGLFYFGKERQFLSKREEIEKFFNRHKKKEEIGVRETKMELP